MTEYTIIHDMKINGKSLVALDKKRAVNDMDKKSVLIGNESFNYSLTHGDNSIIIDTPKDLIGKTLVFV